MQPLLRAWIVTKVLIKNNLDKKKDELNDKKIEEFDKTVDSKVLDKKQEIEKKETEEVNNKEEKSFVQSVVSK